MIHFRNLKVELDFCCKLSPGKYNQQMKVQLLVYTKRNWANGSSNLHTRIALKAPEKHRTYSHVLYKHTEPLCAIKTVSLIAV